jgi:hypothetical protein
MTDEETIREVKRRHSPDLMRRPGVCGVGVERDEHGRPALTVHLESDDPELRRDLPDAIEGYEVRYQVTGPFRALGSSQP